MQKQRFIMLILSVGLALIAVVLIKMHLDQQRSQIMQEAKKRLEKAQANSSSVLVAKKDIPRGSVIAPESLEPAILPNEYVQPRAVTSLDRVAGMLTIADISKGEQITLTKLTQTRMGGGLAEATPAGKRAITISVDNLSSLAGLVKPGDYVDMIAMVAVPVQGADGKLASQLIILPLFQNVLILAVGSETAVMPVEVKEGTRSEGRKEPASLITVALAPQEANFVAFVQEQGKIKLILRSPADAKIETIQPASWDTLSQYIFPQKAKDESLKLKEEVPHEYVEIYRGLNKEKVPLSR